MCVSADGGARTTNRQQMHASLTSRLVLPPPLTGHPICIQSTHSQLTDATEPGKQSGKRKESECFDIHGNAETRVPGVVMLCSVVLCCEGHLNWWWRRSRSRREMQGRQVDEYSGVIVC